MFVNKIIKSIIFSAVLIGAISFTGCSEKQIEIKSTPEERVKLNLSEPQKLVLKPVTYYVLTEKNKEFMSFYAKSKTKGETTIILLQSADAPANRDRYSFISNIARKHISLENSMNRRFT